MLFRSGVLRTVAPSDAQCSELVAIAIAVSLWNVRTSTLVDLSWSVADAASVKLTNAFVDIVADAIGIGVLRTVAPTDAQCIELVAIAIASSLVHVITSPLVYLTSPLPNSARVNPPDAFIGYFADTICICVLPLLAPTDDQSIELVTFPIATLQKRLAS